MHLNSIHFTTRTGPQNVLNKRMRELPWLTQKYKQLLIQKWLSWSSIAKEQLLLCKGISINGNVDVMNQKSRPMMNTEELQRASIDCAGTHSFHLLVWK